MIDKLALADEIESSFRNGIVLDMPLFDVEERMLIVESLRAKNWQEIAASWLENEAEVTTNSLHCGDNSMTIQNAHIRASKLLAAAKIIRGAK